MGKWHIEYWDTGQGGSSIEKWADKLTDEQLDAVTKELKVLEDAGNTLRLPQSRPLGQGVFGLQSIERK